MYKVYCNSKSHRKLQEYSGAYKTREEAETCKQKAEEGMHCNVYGNLIKYQIKESLKELI